MPDSHDFIHIQTADFDQHSHYQTLINIQPEQTGAVVTFCGLVRDLDDRPVKAMQLDHYPEMTLTSLEKIVQKARQRWQLIGVHLVHRIGVLQRHDQIVLVGVAARHRQDAFAACEFIMDFLKQDALFWKAEITESGKQWVEAKQSDQEAQQRWGSEQVNTKIKL